MKKKFLLKLNIKLKHWKSKEICTLGSVTKEYLASKKKKNLK